MPSAYNDVGFDVLGYPTSQTDCILKQSGVHGEEMQLREWWELVVCRR